MVDEETEITLEGFVEDHYRLITTIGVFGALTAFLIRIEPAQDIAVIPFLIFIVLTWELLDSFPEVKLPLKIPIRLIILEFLIAALIIVVGWFIIVTYVTRYYYIFSLTFILGLYMLISAKIIEKTRLLERIHGKVKNQGWYGIIKLVVFLVVVGTVMVLGSLSANYLWSLF